MGSPDIDQRTDGDWGGGDPESLNRVQRAFETRPRAFPFWEFWKLELVQGEELGCGIGVGLTLRPSDGALANACDTRDVSRKKGETRSRRGIPSYIGYAER